MDKRTAFNLCFMVVWLTGLVLILTQVAGPVAGFMFLCAALMSAALIFLVAVADD